MRGGGSLLVDPVPPTADRPSNGFDKTGTGTVEDEGASPDFVSPIEPWSTWRCSWAESDEGGEEVTASLVSDGR